MKTVQLMLPIRFQGYPVVIGHNRYPYIGYKNNIFFFVFNKWLMMALALIVFTIIYVELRTPKYPTTTPFNNYETLRSVEVPTPTKESIELVGLQNAEVSSSEILTDKNPLDYFLDLINRPSGVEKGEATITSLREKFLVEKQILISKSLITHKAARVSQLPTLALLELNKDINDVFTQIILNNIPIEPHAYQFLTAKEPLQKIETALMEQAKFNIPASIKLAQAAVETGYGFKVVSNNYFGIKDKKGAAKPRTTVEYYNQREVQLNQSIILSKKKVEKGGKLLYRCIVKDSFQEYKTPWESFRAHSLFLTENERYAPLFTKGKEYSQWAQKIGSSKYGGVGYATEPVYGQILTKVIERYHLDLLDF